MNPDSIVEMGMASRGKYTLLKMLELVRKIFPNAKAGKDGKSVDLMFEE